MLYALNDTDYMIDHIGAVLGIDIEAVVLSADDCAYILGLLLYYPQLKACKLADGGKLSFLGLGDYLRSKSFAGVFLFGEFPLADGHGELAVGIGVHRCLYILLALGDGVLERCYPLLVLQQLCLCGGDTGIISTLQILKLCKVGAELHLLHYHGVAGSKSFDLGG